MSSLTIDSLTGSMFQNACKYQLEYYEGKGLATAKQYGVQASQIFDPKTGVRQVITIRSLPDLEGVLPPAGHQFIFECKVCSGASFNFMAGHFHDRQFKHLITRASFGATTFIALHWNARTLKTKSEASETWAFPVHPEMQFWIDVGVQSRKMITRQDCRQYAVPIQWATEGRQRDLHPDLLTAISELRQLRQIAKGTSTDDKANDQSVPTADV